MKDRINKLLSLKSLVTLAMTAAVIAVLFRGGVDTEARTYFFSVFSSVITYYFTKKDEQ